MVLKKRSIITSTLLTVMLFWGITQPGEAKPQQQFIPPSQISLQMYALKANGSIDFNVPGGNPACYSITANRTRYGCTFFEGDVNKPYPFSSNTITIGIEDHMLNNVQQGYLHNVISQEMAEGSPLISYAAQAIASRTYAYYQSSGGTVTINNSGLGGGSLPGYQVYLPFRYDGLGEGLGNTIKAERQNTVNQAVHFHNNPRYMALALHGHLIIQ